MPFMLLTSHWATLGSAILSLGKQNTQVFNSLILMVLARFDPAQITLYFMVFNLIVFIYVHYRSFLDSSSFACNPRCNSRSSQAPLGHLFHYQAAPAANA